METTSPPISPIRQYMSPMETSPSSASYREHLRRRTSSFSSNHDRSNPVTPRSSRHRFSNGSQLSGYFGTTADEPSGAASAEGLGNLADELDQLDDDLEEYEGMGATDDSINAHGNDGKETARDSGIDVSYSSTASSKRRSPNNVRNFSKPFGGTEKPPDEAGEVNDDGKEEEGERFSPELEELLHAIARMSSYASTEDRLVERAIALLQDLGNQSALEAAVQRLTTSTNSTTAHLTTQSRSLQALAQTTLLHPLFARAAAGPLDPAVLQETEPLVNALLHDLPRPDPLAPQQLQKLHRDTTDMVAALAALTDTLQMGKQITAAAARHLRSTQVMLVALCRERDQADQARQDLVRGGWNERVKNRYCATECKDIVDGFENTCVALRTRLEAAVAAGA